MAAKKKPLKTPVVWGGRVLAGAPPSRRSVAATNTAAATGHIHSVVHVSTRSTPPGERHTVPADAIATGQLLNKLLDTVSTCEVKVAEANSCRIAPLLPTRNRRFAACGHPLRQVAIFAEVHMMERRVNLINMNLSACEVVRCQWSRRSRIFGEIDDTSE